LSVVAVIILLCLYVVCYVKILFVDQVWVGGNELM